MIAGNKNKIRYAEHLISEEDILAVSRVLRSEWLTQGETVAEFEQAVATYVNSRYAIAVTNGSSALYLACLALGLKQGDCLWTSTNSFVASVNCARFCEANIDFVDIDPNTYTLSAELLAQKLAKAEKMGKIPKIIIPVHFAGQPCDMESIAKLAKQYGCLLIEDAAHAMGAKYLNQQVGCCRYADMCVFSLHPAKIITTGEGGVITTNNYQLYQKLISLRNHGITRNPHSFVKKSPGSWYYEQQSLGGNYRMTDIQAALGISQLRRIDTFIAKREAYFFYYQNLLKTHPLILPWQHPDGKSSHHLYVIQVAAKQRSAIFHQLQKAGIEVNVHYIPIHLQPYYQQLGFKIGDFPNAENYYARAITLPLHCNLSIDDLDFVVNELMQSLYKYAD